MTNRLVAAASLNQTPLDWSGNQRRIIAALKEAQQQQVVALCLPELCISGYGCEDCFLLPETAAKAWKSLINVIPYTTGLLVTLGLPLHHAGQLYNAVAVVLNGQLQGLVAKKELANYGVYYEKRWFSTWRSRNIETYQSFDGQSIQLGPNIFAWDGWQVGIEICEEAWINAHQCDFDGIDLVMHSSASHYEFSKQLRTEALFTRRSQQFKTNYAYANLLGNEAGRCIYSGNSTLISNGSILKQAPLFAFDDYNLISALMPAQTNITASTASSMLGTEDMAPDMALGKALTMTSDITSDITADTVLPKNIAVDTHYAEFTAAVALGLWDYLRKSGACGFQLSLSGGIDSSAVAFLVSEMLQRAVAKASPDELRKVFRLNADQPLNADQLMPKVLYTLYQASSNSSEHTRKAAQAVAQAIAAEHDQLNIQPLVEAYEGLVSEIIGRELNWSTDDLARQNIQARVRSPGLWMLANLRGLLLLSTANRSEAAVGYLTIDGDSSGGLAPLAGVSKEFLKSWMRWLKEQRPQFSAAIDQVLKLPPTAELRPSIQSDEADLMPYSILDFIEHKRIAERLSWADINEQLKAKFSDYPTETLSTFLEKFKSMHRVTQWKRERLAPSFHIDDHSLDPRFWYRHPLLSGTDEN